MVKITRITAQKKNDKRLNIFIDEGTGEKFGFSIDLDVFAKYNLRKGLVLEDELLRELLYEDEVKKGFQLALNYLSYRIRSQKEIEDYLIKKEVNEGLIPSVIQKLADYKYIDDKEFAKAYVRTKKRTTVKGPAVLKRELIEKGLSQAHIEAGISEYSFEEQVDAATMFVKKKSNQSSKRSNREAEQKIKQTLLQKGFTYEVIEMVFSEMGNMNDTKEEWEALNHHAEKAKRKYRNYRGRELEMKVTQYLYRRGFPIDKIKQWWNEYLEKE